MNSNNNQQHEVSMTTVKVFTDKYNNFKKLTDGEFSLQKLVNRTIYLYVNDPEFRNKIQTTNDLKISGSAF